MNLTFKFVRKPHRRNYMNINEPTKQLLNTYNTPDVELVISEWPEDDTTKPYHGVAAFTKDTLLTQATQFSKRFVVLAETNDDQFHYHTYADGNIIVLRVFNHTHPSLYPTILTWLSRFPAIEKVTVHSEFGAYSGMKHFILLLPFLLLIRITGRHITYVAHNIVGNINLLAPHLGIEEESFTTTLINKGLAWYYRFLGFLTHSIITLDTYAHGILKSYIDHKKIHFIPHWVKQTPSQRMAQAEAKKLLDIPAHHKILLVFGFISWYKGTDRTMKAFKQIAKDHPNMHLVIAGGQAPSIAHTPVYNEYFTQLMKEAEKTSTIHVTGFIPDAEVPMYFSAADLVLLPYRGLMGGSGTLAHAIGYEKPFLISHEMKAFLDNPDVQTSLHATELTKDDVLFTPTRTGLSHVVRLLHNKKLHILSHLSTRIKQKRSVTSFCEQLEKTSTTEKTRVSWLYHVRHALSLAII